MSLAVLSFRIANDEMFLTKLAENFSQVLEQEGFQLSTADENSLRAAVQEKKAATYTDPDVEPWAIG
jgi:hypothetical protein